ncbi:uncharacterized protein LOC107266793 [Cephus cinctus]|uniref:Uncharacterized protein LOC107266793 n=1 Tax=Cephus cinctus TaxID=211228 RepID=A0AAJ7BT65_CEPCN|nr:uncharacterized protein LOC107266793 [Cephus cinctus]
MNKFGAFFILMAVLVCGQARVAREVPANQPVQLSDLIAQAQSNINNLGTQIQQQLQLIDQETIVNTIKNQSSTLASNVQSYVNQVSEDVKSKSPEIEKLWADIKGKLSKAVNDINAQLPDGQQQAAELQAKFNAGIQTIVQESDKVAKSISQNSSKVREEVANFTKQAVDIAVQATQNLNNQLQQAAKSS